MVICYEWKKAWPKNGSHEKPCYGYMKKTALWKKNHEGYTKKPRSWEKNYEGDMKKNGELRKNPARVKDKSSTIQNIPHVVAWMGYTHGHILKPSLSCTGHAHPVCSEWFNKLPHCLLQPCKLGFFYWTLDLPQWSIETCHGNSISCCKVCILNWIWFTVQEMDSPWPRYPPWPKSWFLSNVNS